VSCRAILGTYLSLDMIFFHVYRRVKCKKEALSSSNDDKFGWQIGLSWTMGTSKSTPHITVVVAYTKGIAPTTWLSPLAVSLQLQESSTRPERKISTAWTYRRLRKAPRFLHQGKMRSGWLRLSRRRRQQQHNNNANKQTSTSVNQQQTASITNNQSSKRII
jgi:hypothetical protein